MTKEFKNGDTITYEKCERCGEYHFIHETCPPPPLGINVSEKTGSKEKIG